MSLHFLHFWHVFKLSNWLGIFWSVCKTFFGAWLFCVFFGAFCSKFKQNNVNKNERLHETAKPEQKKQGNAQDFQQDFLLNWIFWYILQFSAFGQGQSMEQYHHKVGYLYLFVFCHFLFQFPHYNHGKTVSKVPRVFPGRHFSSCIRLQPSGGESRPLASATKWRRRLQRPRCPGDDKVTKEGCVEQQFPIDFCHASQSLINKQCTLNIFEWETAVAELNFAPLCQIP